MVSITCSDTDLPIILNAGFPSGLGTDAGAASFPGSFSAIAEAVGAEQRCLPPLARLLKLLKLLKLSKLSKQINHRHKLFSGGLAGDVLVLEARVLSAFDTLNIEVVYNGTTPDNVHLKILGHILSVDVGGEKSASIWLPGFVLYQGSYFLQLILRAQAQP